MQVHQGNFLAIINTFAKIKVKRILQTYYAVIADQVTVRYSKVFSVTDVFKIFDMY